jgi:two-component system CheB/CheR fusion protein
VVTDGPAALQAAEDFRPEAAVIDLRLPGLDVPELVRRLRQAHAGPDDLVLVALSEAASESDRTRAAASGFDRFLTLPLNPEALRNALAAPPAGPV